MQHVHNRGGHRQPCPATMPPDSLSVFAEGISLVLSRWTALQTAVQNDWGGRDSSRKSVELASMLRSWFSHSKFPHDIDDLESILEENLVLSFNTEIEDGSIEEEVGMSQPFHQSISTLRQDPRQTSNQTAPERAADPIRDSAIVICCGDHNPLGEGGGHNTVWYYPR